MSAQIFPNVEMCEAYVEYDLRGYRFKARRDFRWSIAYPTMYPQDIIKHLIRLDLIYNVAYYGGPNETAA